MWCEHSFLLDLRGHCNVAFASERLLGINAGRMYTDWVHKVYFYMLCSHKQAAGKQQPAVTTMFRHLGQNQKLISLSCFYCTHWFLVSAADLHSLLYFRSLHQSVLYTKIKWMDHERRERKRERGCVCNVISSRCVYESREQQQQQKAAKKKWIKERVQRMNKVHVYRSPYRYYSLCLYAKYYMCMEIFCSERMSGEFQVERMSWIRSAPHTFLAFLLCLPFSHKQPNSANTHTHTIFVCAKYTNITSH